VIFLQRTTEKRLQSQTDAPIFLAVIGPGASSTTKRSGSYAADCDVIVCYGGAKSADKHLASTVHCVDDESRADSSVLIRRPRGAVPAIA
jgi:hypothetical protein